MASQSFRVKNSLQVGTGVTITSGGNITAGVVTATSFVGSGSQLTQIVVSTVVGGAISATSLSVTGVSTFDGAVKIRNGYNLNIGDNNDLRIYNDGENSRIQETGSGTFYISGSDINIQQDSTNKNFARFVGGGAAELYYNDSKKFETSGIGITVTGTINSNQINVSGITTTARLNVGTGGTVITTTVAGLVGIGTTNPQTKLEVNGVLRFTGNNNIKIGNVSTGSSLSYGSGENNFFAGQNAGQFTTNGSNNTFVGSGAGSSNINGSDNNILGYQAGQFNTSGYNNNFFGSYAGNSNTTGSSNNFFGGIAVGGSNTTGSDNNFFGSFAGQSNTSGSDNIYIGQETGNNNVTGSQNVIIGKGQNAPILNGSNQLVIGAGSTTWITGNSSYNVGIGTSNPQTKLEINGVLGFTGGVYGGANIKIGNVSTGSSITYANDNVFIGNDAGKYTTYGSFNLFVGSYAGSNNISGSHNNFLGENAGVSNIDGSYNNCFGQYAGYSNSSGILNNFIGISAGQSNTTGSDNIYLGTNAGNANQTGSENVIIGKGRNAPILNGSNQLVIGAGSTSWITGNSSYNVGIGTTNPTSKLHVSGVVTATTYYGDISNAVSGRWVLGASGSSDYTFTGIGFTQTTNDPTLYLKRGEVYEFVNNSGGSHPFQIRVSNGGAAYNNGVTNNGASSGTIIFQVPYNAPDTLYYQCTNHSAMGGDIIVLGGVRSIPQNSQASAYILAASDIGKHVSITTGGVTINTGIFSAGDAVSIYNNSGSNQTITQGTSVTLRQAGTANTGNRTLAQYGVCTVLCVGSETFVITGAGLS